MKEQERQTKVDAGAMMMMVTPPLPTRRKIDYKGKLRKKTKSNNST